MRLSLLLSCYILLLSVPALAEYEVECNFDPIKLDRVSVYTLPDGSGNGLDEAFLWDGVPGRHPAIVDATITMTLLAYGEPVYMYPKEDLWLESSQGSLVLCPGGSIADNYTDINGQTTFSKPLLAGGATDPDAGELTVVMINGMPCSDTGLD
ncbi:MAG: hypothetical protein ABIF77_01845, partial [bacterium]